MFQRLLVAVDPLLFGFLRRLPDEKIRRYGSSKYRYEGRKESRAPSNFWNDEPFDRLSPRHLHNGKRDDIRK